MQLEIAHALALRLMQYHDLRDWNFQFDEAVKRFGYCHYSRKLISLSAPIVLLNSDEQVKNTILHEIAHALVPWGGHGKGWKETAISIGCDGKRCYDSTVTQPTTNWRAVCDLCGFISNRYRRPKKSRHYFCKMCTDKNKKFDFAWAMHYHRVKS
jgi:predicted SprT family Zn-dependent metalloprotease